MFATLAGVSGGTLSPVVAGQGLVLAEARVLPVPGPLAPLLPGGIRRGSVVGVSGNGGTALSLALLAEPLAQGSWAAVVGEPDLGVEAAAGMGVDLSRVALVPRPGPSWPAVLAVLLDSVDLVVLRPPGRPRPSDARRLVVRARERGSVLVVMGAPDAWPEPPELTLATETEGWEGLGAGSGTLRRRRVRMVTSGRREAERPRAATCWLPGPDGKLAPRRGRGRSAAPAEPESEAMPWAG
jgi:hypothetical protein